MAFLSLNVCLSHVAVKASKIGPPVEVIGTGFMNSVIE